MKKRVRVTQLEIGDVIANDIMYYGRRQPLVTKDTVINEYIRHRLDELGIVFVKIYDPDYVEKKEKLDTSKEQRQKNKKVFRAKYNQNVSNMKDVFTDIAKGNTVNIHKVLNVSNEIFKDTQDVYTIIDSISEIREIDDYTYRHSINVSLYAMLLGKWLGLKEQSLKELIQTGVLHDIGKGKVDQDILNKPGKLTDEEFEEIKKHTIYGYEICKPVIWLNDNMKNGVLMHHEKSDGSGYPLGLKEDNISLCIELKKGIQERTNFIRYY